MFFNSSLIGSVPLFKVIKHKKSSKVQGFEPVFYCFKLNNYVLGLLQYLQNSEALFKLYR